MTIETGSMTRSAREVVRREKKVTRCTGSHSVVTLLHAVLGLSSSVKGVAVTLTESMLMQARMRTNTVANTHERTHAEREHCVVALNSSVQLSLLTDTDKGVCVCVCGGGVMAASCTI